MLVARPSWLQPGLTLGQVHDWINRQNITVQASQLADCHHAIWNHETRTILISPSVPQDHRLAILTHEALHIYNGHRDPQPPSIETVINRYTAIALINFDQYTYWEQEYSGHPGGIAKALAQPVWLIQSFQSIYRATKPVIKAS